jgi:plasmid stabilization system protein ParE
MPQLIWSPAALRDVERHYNFLVVKNPVAARGAVKAIRQGMSILETQLAAGRPVPDMDPEFREWFINFGGSGYIALYRLDSSTAVVLAVRHQREAGY